MPRRLCFQALRTGRCTREQCIDRHDVEFCQVCGRYMQPEHIEVHLCGVSVAASTTTTASATVSAQTPSSHSTIVPAPSDVVDGIQQDDAVDSEHLHVEESEGGIDEEYSDSSEDDVSRGPGASILPTHTNLIVSDEDGVEFGEVERTRNDEPFPSSTQTITITRTRASPGIKLIDVSILSGNRAARRCFSVTSGNSGSQWVKHGRPRTIILSFNPESEGYFRASIKLTFHISNGPDFVVKRALMGTAQRPPYRMPRTFVPLRPPTWTETKWSHLLQDHELPRELADNLAIANPEQHEDKLKRVAKRMVPGTLTSETYVARFHALLFIEEVALLRHLQETVIREVEIIAKHPRYEVTISETEDQELPEAGMVGDFVLLDDPLYDMTYEGRVHVRKERYNSRTKRDEVTLVLRMPEGFNVYRRSIFNLRFKLNRVPLRRAHAALSALCHPPRLMFPTPNNVPAAPRFAVDADQLVLHNEALRRDEKQLQAVLEVLQRPRGNVPFIIYGPPGTGKTTTGIECVLQLLLRDSSLHILVCAPSNSAADLITYRLAEHLDEAALFRLTALSRSHLDIAEEHAATVLKHSARNEHDVFAIPSGTELAKFRVIVCTCCTAGALASAGIKRGHFGWVFVDEAAQASEPDAMVPIRGMVGENTDVVLMGDPKQLRPVIMSQCAKSMGLGISYLERLMCIKTLYSLGEEGDGADGSGAPPGQTNVVQLQLNRRSHAGIIAFSNSMFYEDRLRARAYTVTARALFHSPVLPNGRFPVTFHGIRGKEEQKRLSKSYFNAVEAQVVVQYCRSLLQDNERPVSPEEIGIISPYKAQVRHIKAVLRGARIEGVTVGSVEQFQGQERRVIIVSTARSNGNRNRKAFGFLNDPHRLNVALTRAQALLVVVGDPTVLGQDLLWRTFLNYVHSRGGRKGERYNWDPAVDILPRGYERVTLEQARADGEEFLSRVRTQVLRYSGT